MVGGEKKYISLRVRCRVDFLFSTIFSWRFSLALLFGRLCNASQVQGYSRPLSFGQILSHVLLFAEFLGVNFFFFFARMSCAFGPGFQFWLLLLLLCWFCFCSAFSGCCRPKKQHQWATTQRVPFEVIYPKRRIRWTWIFIVRKRF